MVQALFIEDTHAEQCIEEWFDNDEDNDEVNSILPNIRSKILTEKI